MSKQETLEEDRNGNIIQFLCGSHSYDGVWFGDKPPTKKGFFWWRSILKEWQQQQQDESKHSDEEMIELIQFLSMNEEFNGYGSVSKETAKYFLEQFKRK